jgi:hypothetical protein
MDRQVPATTVGSALAELVGGVLVGLAVLGPGGGLAAVMLLLLAVAGTYLGRGFWTRSGAFAFPLSLVGALGALTVSLTAAAGPPAWGPGLGGVGPRRGGGDGAGGGGPGPGQPGDPSLPGAAPSVGAWPRGRRHGPRGSRYPSRL